MPTCLGKGKVFSENSNLTNLVEIQRQHENGKRVTSVSDEVYTFSLKVLAIPHGRGRVYILDPPWCNNSCWAYQELSQGDFYSFDQEKVPFLSYKYYLPTQKCNHKKIMLTSISSIVFVKE